MRGFTVPANIVRLLVFWYSHQQMFVKWGNVMSSVFTVSNSVRQGVHGWP